MVLDAKESYLNYKTLQSDFHTHVEIADNRIIYFFGQWIGFMLNQLHVG